MGLGLEAPPEGRWVRLVEGRFVPFAATVWEPPRGPRRLSRAPPAPHRGAVDPCGGMPSSGSSLGFSPSSSLLESPTSKPTRGRAGIADPEVV